MDLKIGIAGLGTVGLGVIELLAERAALLVERCGRRIVVTAVSSRDRHRDRGVDIGAMQWFDDPRVMAADADVDVIVELIGGSGGVALDVCNAAIAAGKPVVTANKAMIAHHGAALAEAAEAAGVSLGYEAAVAGGIPIVKALREGLAGNRIERVYGILNGTCNYILSAMSDNGSDFDDVLAEAQRLGYAEADPSFDIDGIDAAHKIAILASLAFGTVPNLAGVHTEGISRITSLDTTYAAELGYRIKLLGVANMTDHGLEQRVHPCMVPQAAQIAQIEGVFNAVVTEGDFVDRTMFCGRGAGAGPTASAVVADLVDVARGNVLPTFGVPAGQLRHVQAASMARHVGAYYIRLRVIDQPGVMADVTAALGDAQVSVKALIQHSHDLGDGASVVLTTHETGEASMLQALKVIAALDTVLEAPCMIRIEQL
ncbi:MAG: homoserine dehydrogenase [Proteobacteria bacterium]|nr:homoserine dehydrogenase [Pseudomonadota bacterium]